ncbi:DUF418 domain-containing protein [Kordiimonas aquimaris]|uniref:DUF418 domain-containing protein n=1 Tax=Kordiimonas aquimaris TaxID=707591 RepID=UPI0021D0B92A|nr:DUF418 domain-containing protein [Kordiimonas aquimaris]
MNETQPARIELLDVIRGVAVLGILLMNIRMFSEPSAAYFNPNAYGNFTGIDKIWWTFQYVFADQKFMAIFSMLFGASTAIICDGLMRRGEPVFATYAKRIIGLLLIGLAHAYLLWSGDILVSYALASFIPFLFRNVRWYLTALAGLGLLAFGALSSVGAYYYFIELPAEAINEISQQMWQPTETALLAEVNAHQGTWLEHFAYRMHHAWEFQTDIFLSWGIWRVGGMMLLGLALYRQGFLAGKWTGKAYAVTALIFVTLGLGLVVNGFLANEAAMWQFPYSFFLGNIWNYAGSAVTAIGYIAIIGWLLNSTNFRFGFTAFANVGRAALSNYLFQTIFCITIFYGFGLGLYGELVRAQAAFIVFAAWATQITLTSLWFRHKSKGPIESIWHRFTYARWFGSGA